MPSLRAGAELRGGAYAVAGAGFAAASTSLRVGFLTLRPIMSSLHSWATFSMLRRANRLNPQLRLTSPNTVSTSVDRRLRRIAPSSLVSLSAAFFLGSSRRGFT